MTKTCLLHQAEGRLEHCPAASCGFWEDGGAVLASGCSIERLGLTAELHRTPDLAGWLLNLREQLERAATELERRDARRRFAELVPPELRD